MESLTALREFLAATYSWETISRSLADYRIMLFPVLSTILLLGRIGVIKSMLYASLCFANIIALYSQVQLGGPSMVIATLGAIFGIAILYFVYLLTLGATVRA
jgi:hypothetical protein